MSGAGARQTIAPAKINWTLEVLGRRPDGYHEIRSVMQTISLVDDLSVRPAPVLTLRVTGRGADSLAEDGNLVLRAARAFPDRLACRPVAFTLHKRIPAAAGLGGGSSDAAATLRLLCDAWDLGGCDALAGVAASLGSDVPFFLRGGTQVAAGRGELLTPLPSITSVSLVLLTPPITIPGKTASLFAQLDRSNYTDGGATARLAEGIQNGSSATPADYVNVFDAPADRVFPDLRDYRRALERATGERAMLAGTGPSLFAVCAAPAAAVAALSRAGLTAWAVHTTG